MLCEFDRDNCGGGGVRREDALDAGEGDADADWMRGERAGAGVVAVGPGDRADAIVCDTSARSTEARFWLFEKLREE
jgi:hypothetical protein